MNKFFLMLICFIITTSTCLADAVLTKDGPMEGRIDTLASGLIILKNGSNYTTFTRSVSDDFFEDIAVYKDKFWFGQYYSVPCRVSYVDNMHVKIYTRDSYKEMPRYKVKEVVVKVP